MEIKTKFDLNQQVWILINNQILRKEISGIRIEELGTDSLIKYRIKSKYEYFFSFNSTWMEERYLFETKEELIQSLIK